MSRERGKYSGIVCYENVKRKTNDLKRLYKLNEAELSQLIVDYFIASHKEEIDQKIQSYFKELR